MKAGLVCSLVVLVHLAKASWVDAANPISVEELMAPPKVHLRKIENIKLARQPAPDQTNSTKIQNLIAGMINISKPDFGFSPTISGTAFAPVAGMERPGALIFTDHQLQRSDDFTELARLGPAALPFLIAGLTNQTPTKLDVEHHFGFGAMWFANELSGNPGNRKEQDALGPPQPYHFGGFENSVSDYQVTIGDICFVAIGQIVGRPYLAIRYQPTACIVLNSPTHDTNIARQVRQIWSSKNPRQHLLDSLLLDFASEGVFNGQSLDGWDVGSDLQCGAAMRLLYYYPRQSARLIAQRLHGLDVSSGGTNVDTWIAREVKNGVRTADFIRSVAWCQESVIQSELKRIFRRTDDPKILEESCAGFGANERPMVQKRFGEFIGKLPETEHGPFGTGYNLLVKLGQQAGHDARPVFEGYIRNASLQRRRSLCRVLQKTCGEWSVELLSPVLDDQRPAEGWTYGVVPDQNEPRLPIRICDEAAETISINFPKLKFKMAGEHKDLDAQIDKMKQAIAQKNY